MNQKFGTSYYIAPEVLKLKYDEKCDVWSCGVILYIILSGHPPFDGETDKAILEKVAKGKYNFDFEEWNYVSKEAKNLVTRMLDENPATRMTALEALNHPWIKEKAVDATLSKNQTIKVFNNIKNFKTEQKLQHAIYVFLVNNLATKEEKNELYTAFKALDLDGDGQISKAELTEGYKKLFGEAQAPAEVENIMRSLGVNGRDTIDYSEFLVANMNKQSLLSVQRLEAAFKILDNDGTGYVTKENIKTVFPSGKQLDGMWKDLMKEMDSSPNGKISWSQFKEFMLKFGQEK